MNALIAILKDSFWSIYSSKILHLSIGLTFLILLALSPFGYKEQLATTVFSQDVKRVDRIFRKIESATESKDDSLAKEFWDCLSEEQKEGWKKAKEEFDQGGRFSREERNARSELVTIFNDLIKGGELTEKIDDESLIQNSEAKDLMSRPDLLSRTDNKERLSRLLISEVFGRSVEAGRQSNIRIVYGFYETPELPITRLVLEGIIRSAAPGILDKFVLSIGLLVAIILTASMVPQMLEDGSLYLLLSKPVSRVFLLCAKFLGSTLFVLIFSTCLLGGFWLLLGIRFHLWIHALLWSIPVYIVIFMVYYSVTMGVGLFFRNTIAAIILTAIFWVFCFSFTSANFWFQLYLNFFQSREVAVVSEVVYRRNPNRTLHILNDSNEWGDPLESVAGSGDFGNFTEVLRPVFWKEKSSILSLVKENRRRGNNSSSSIHVSKVVDGKITKSFKGISAPRNLVSLFFNHENQLLGISDQGSVYQLESSELSKLDNELTNGAAKDKQQKGKQSNSILGSVLKNFQNTETNKASKSNPWKFIGKVTEAKLLSSDSIKYDAEKKCFYALTRHKIFVSKWNPSSEKYELEKECGIPWSYKKSLSIPFGETKRFLIFPLRNGPVVVLDKETLEVKQELKVESATPLGSSSSASENYYAIAYGHNGIWIFDDEKETLVSAPGASGYNCTAVDIKSDGNMLFAHGYNRLSELKKDSWTYLEQKNINLGFAILFYDWGTGPLYRILPKPAECFRLVEHLAKDTESEEEILSTASQQDIMFGESLENSAGSPYSPVITSAIFACFVMAINCLYFATREY